MLRSAFLAVDPTIPQYDTISPGAVGTSVASLVAVALVLMGIIFGTLVFKYGSAAVFGALKSALGIVGKSTRTGPK